VTRAVPESLAVRLDRESALPDATVLDVVGQVGFALQALHDKGQAHGDVSAETIDLYDDGAVTLRPAAAGRTATSSGDLAALGRVARDAVSPAADPATRRFLDRLADPPRGTTPEAGDVARTALAMIAGSLQQTAPRPAAEPTQPTQPTVDAAVDPDQRRVRNRFIAVGAAVVLLGLVLLKACGGSAGETVPHLTGDTYAVAKSALHAHGLAVRERLVSGKPGQPAGLVIGQSSAAGTRLHAGTVVTLTVAR
jgi:hypothetical protein